MKWDILMFGVGGQGTVLSSDIVCEVALLNGFDAKKSEIHGMAQRGGSVVSHVRIGRKVYSPVIPEGSADILVSFEYMEFLRYLNFINENSILILNTNKIYPPSVLSGKESYPDNIISEKLSIFREVEMLDALNIAKNVGNLKVAGMAVVGKLAGQLPFDTESWLEVIREKVPLKTVESNVKAFKCGLDSL
jgi:indolepyruvate ferredoxin oxidoreductase beta subunit